MRKELNILGLKDPEQKVDKFLKIKSKVKKQLPKSSIKINIDGNDIQE